MEDANRRDDRGLPGRAAPSHGVGLSGRGVVLVGGGGHACVVAEAVWLLGGRVAGFYDDAEDSAAGRFALPGEGEGLARLGPVSAAGEAGLEVRGEAPGWIVAIGDVGVRRGLIDRLEEGKKGGGAVSAVHPSAWVSPTAGVSREGVFVGPRAVVHAAARVGAHAIVNSGAVVEHHVEVGENVHVAPGVVLGGGTRVGRDTLIGIGARTLPGVTIGEGALVGAGAVVLGDVAAGERVVGVVKGRG